MQRNSGFTLVETSIVLAIGASILTAGLILGVKKLDNIKFDETEAKLKELTEAIDDYYDEFSRLPCPADPTIGFTEAGFGLEERNGGSNGCEDSAANLIESASGNVFAGAVPVNTLNIDPSFALDSWSRRTTYIVDGDLTYTGTPATRGDIDVRNLFNSGSGFTSEIIAQDSGATDNNTPLTITSAAFLLLSHGYNGYGAWAGSGAAVRQHLGKGELSDKENYAQYNNTATFDAVFVQSVLTTTYDDIVEYMTLWQLTGAE